jgi:hypothetical protein
MTAASTVRVEPSRRDIVVSRFDAEPRGTWDSEYADPQPDQLAVDRRILARFLT